MKRINLNKLMRPHIRKISPEIRRDLDACAILDGTENMFGYSPKIRDLIHIDTRLNIAPDPSCRELKASLQKYHQVSYGKLFVGNGAIDVVDHFFRIFLQPGDNVIIPSPTYPVLNFEVDVNFGTLKKIELEKDFYLNPTKIINAIDQNTKIILLVNPQNPTGNIIPKRDIAKIAQAAYSKGVLLVIDEVYAEYARENNIELIDEYNNVFIIRSFSKAFGLAGLRVGYGLGSEELIKLLKKRPPLKISRVSQLAAKYALEDADHFYKLRDQIDSEKTWLHGELNNLDGVKAYMTRTNFLIAKFPAKRFRERLEILAKNRIFVKNLCKFPLLKHHVRIGIGTRKQNELFLKELKKLV